MAARALIVVDVQNDFCEGGSLPVAGGAAVAAAVSRHMATSDYDHVVATRDHHVDPGAHFSASPDFVHSWPPHCRVGTPGASFHPDLDVAPIQAVFSKGAHAAAYSGFEGADPDGRTLAEWLHERGVSTVDVVGIATDHCVRATALDAAAVVGIATDHCVRATALDAAAAGLATTVLLDLTAGVAPATVDAAVAQLRSAGVALRGTPLVGG